MDSKRELRDKVRGQTVGQQNERQLVFEDSMVNVEERTVEVVFATPEKYRRWWGDEVLAISPEAIRGRRLDKGAAVLWNHNRDEQIGVVESWSIDVAAQKARAVLRFSRNSERAEQVFRDIADRIIRGVSFGYIVHGMRVIEERDDVDTWLVDDYEPFEISPVSVAADPNAGIGRSMQDAPPEADNATTPDNQNPQPDRQPVTPTTGERMNETTTAPAAPAQPDAGAVQAAITAERERTAEILDMGKRFGDVDAAREFASTGKTADDFRRHLLERRSSKPSDERSRSVGMTEKDARKYSFIRALRYMAATNESERKRAADAAGFELELHDAMLGNGVKSRGGILVPDDVLQSRAFSPFNTLSSGSDSGDTGGNVVDTTLMTGSFVDLLRNSNVMMRLGTTMTGLVGNIDIPRQISGAQGYWVAEDGSVSAGSQELDQISMSPKTVGAYSEITRRLLMQSSLDIEALVRRDLAAAIATTIDTAALYGNPDGGSNQPRGIRNYDGILGQDFAAESPSYAELVEMESKVAAQNTLVDNMAFVIHPSERGSLKTTQKFPGTNGVPIWEPGNTVNGYRTEVTNQVSKGDVFFGNWSDFLIGMWGGFEIMTDPYTHSLKGRLRIVVFQDVDFVLRRNKSFCYGVQPAVPAGP